MSRTYGEEADNNRTYVLNITRLMIYIEIMDTVKHFVEKYRMGEFLNQTLLENLAAFQFPADSTVFFEQSETTYLYFLVDGELQCAHYHANGTLAVVALAKPFAAIGDVEILNHEPTTTAVVTTRPSVLLGVPRRVVDQHGTDDPRFLRFLIDQITKKLYDTTNLRLGHLLPLKSRFALYLRSLPGIRGGSVAVLPDKDSLASMLGASSRHLNRILRDLKSSGVIGEGYPGVRILDPEALNKLIG